MKVFSQYQGNIAFKLSLFLLASVLMGFLRLGFQTPDLSGIGMLQQSLQISDQSLVFLCCWEKISSIFRKSRQHSLSFFLQKGVYNDISSK